MILFSFFWPCKEGWCSLLEPIQSTLCYSVIRHEHGSRLRQKRNHKNFGIFVVVVIVFVFYLFFVVVFLFFVVVFCSCYCICVCIPVTATASVCVPFTESVSRPVHFQHNEQQLRSRPSLLLNAADVSAVCSKINLMGIVIENSNSLEVS